VSGFRADLAQGWRSVRARPAATAATLAVLALGIGLSTAIFALADPFLWRPLPYDDPARLAVVRCTVDPARPGEVADRLLPTFDDWRARHDLFTDLAAYGEQYQVRVVAPGGAILRTIPVSENFFSVLGLELNVAPWRPVPAGAEGVIAVAASSRMQVLGAPRELPGTLLFAEDSSALRVVATMPAEFVFPAPRVTAQPDALSPAAFGAMIVRQRGTIRLVTAIARLRSGITPQLAQAALAGRSPHGVRIDVQPLSTFMTSRQRPAALGALAAGLLITLICAANVINLLIARGTYRTREFATRLALGATRLHLLRLVLVELGIVALLAILASLVLAQVTLIGIRQVAPAEYTLLGQPAITLRVLAFSTLLGVGLVAVAIPAVWFTWRATLSSPISQSLSIEGRRVRWLRFIAAAGQSATAMILLVGGTLLARSQMNLWSQQTGVAADARVVSVSYPRAEPRHRVAEDAERTAAALRNLAGVRVAAALAGSLLDDFTTLGGQPIRVAGRAILMTPKEITPDYFDSIGATLCAGRSLRPEDRAWSAVVINEALARQLWPHQAPERAVGQVFAVGDGRATGQIVGVVRNSFDRALDVLPAPTMFRRMETPTGLVPIYYIVRTDSRYVDTVDAAVRRTVRRINPEALVLEAAPLNARLAATVKDRSFTALILGLFTVAGVGVTASGLFGIVVFVVGRRTREIAIRVAIGARRRNVRWLVVREALTAAWVGAAAGLMAGSWLSKLLEHQLYGIQTGDLGSLVCAAILMAGVAAVAAWIPANRALSVAPNEVLRTE